MHIRAAERGDVGDIADIYNYEVLNGFSTFDINIKSDEEMMRWFKSHDGDTHPILVACDGERVIGYASLSRYRIKEAYAATAELSVYVARDCRGSGVATALLSAILEYARGNDGIHTVISVITAGNEASVHLHTKFGFSFCGRMNEVGVKNGRLLDILNYQLMV